MTKRIQAFALSLLLLLTLAAPALAAEPEAPEKPVYKIYHTKDFLTFSQDCRLDSFSQDLTVELLGDVDLTETNFSGIPIFCGTFEGNGHTIRGLNIAADGSAQGLFRYLKETAVVQNLLVEGSVTPGGTHSDVGGIAGSNEGRILHCSVSGNISGADNVGGVAGINAITGIIENCMVAGTITGSHFTGGIAGKNSGVIRICENTANVNDTAQQNKVTLTDISLESVTGSETAVAVTDVGGIAGISNGVIRDCINRGTVGYRHMGFNIGGIAGTQSGLIQNCQNYGSIQGRKEVGGIVGQMEPTALIEYEEDALQILQRQLSGMGSIVNETMSNVQGTGETILGQVTTLKNHVTDAREAVDSLVPNEEDSTLPDMDTIQAAQNTLSSSFSGMTQTLQGMGGTAYNAMGAMSTNLYSLQNQINAMRSTLGNVSQTLGGSMKDVSDQDNDEDLTGKVTACANYGPILADRNAGGIAGAMAMENDLDPEEDWQLKGSNSLNFESELRAVISDCENTAKVTVKKENAGGITGWQSMGLIKNTHNTGAVDAASADYVGGISGQSKGFIRNCAAKAQVSGTNCVGGIAGSATVVSHCRSMVKLAATGEQTGEVLGITEEPYAQETDPILENYYLSVADDQGGIDGVSYQGEAQPLDQETFLLLEGPMDLFRQVCVRFQYGNGTERSFPVSLGGSFDKTWAPPIPPQAGALAVWAGLEEADLSQMSFDVTFESQYIRQKTVLASEESMENQPLLLVQGSFHQQSTLTLAPISPIPEGPGSSPGAWEFTVNDAQSITTARLRLPPDSAEKKAAVLLRSADGTWRQGEHYVDGSYLVIPLESGESGIALYLEERVPIAWIAGSAAAVILIFLFLGYRKKRKKTA